MNKRIESIDILRGFTIVAMILVNNPGTWSHIYAPLRHAKWHGLTPTDLVFPFFLFIVGLSINFAFIHKTKNRITYKKIGVRGLKLIGLGLFLNLFLPYYPFLKNIESLRIPGVLQRIGVVYMIASTLHINFSWKTLLLITVSILIGYWLWLGFVPLHGELPTFDRAANNWANYIDVQFFGSHTWKTDYDPEGLLSTIPAVATSIIGILIGKILYYFKEKSTAILSVLGVSLLALGYLWSNWFPINKAIWSSSFVLVTSGWGTLVLTLIHYLTDVKKVHFGNLFKYVGMNAILIFFMSGFISKSFSLIKVNGTQSIHHWLYTSIYTNNISTDKLSSLLYAFTIILFYVSVSYVLYKKKIFFKV